MKILDPEIIVGNEDRPEWLPLREADDILVDGLSTDEFADARYSRFRNFLFDSGFVPIRSGLDDRPRPHILYARSSLLPTAAVAGMAGSSFVSMGCLGSLGRFGNQIWQYLFVRMYGLRNGLVVRVPEWEGEQVFGFADERPLAGHDREQMSILGMGDIDLELWEVDDAPRNLDFKGHFQNVPPSWRVHRDFIRTMFKLRPDWQDAVAQLSQSLAAAGRTLVAIHVRRGDYKRGQYVSPLYRLAPVDWYMKLLDDIWPQLSRPVLHVSTDEPRAIRPLFQKYEQLDASFSNYEFRIPAHVVDFALLKEADHLVACNSSFSAAAALLGKPAQKCYIVDFESMSFVPYDPWTEVSFGRRFLPESPSIAALGYGLHGARRRVLAAGGQAAAKIRLESELASLRERMNALEAVRGSLGKRLVHRVWRSAKILLHRTTGWPVVRSNEEAQASSGGVQNPVHPA